MNTATLLRQFAVATALTVASCQIAAEPPKKLDPLESATGAGEDPAMVAAEMAKWQGTWRCVERNEEGTLLPDEDVTKISMKIDENVFEFQWGSEFREAGHYTLYPSATPKAVDIMIESPDELAGRRLKLIYRMNGDATTMTTIHREDGQRPSEFTAEPDSGQTEEFWRKVVPPPPPSPEKKLP